MIYGISYANKKYRNSQILNSRTALLHGVNKVIEYSPDDIEEAFYIANKEILSCQRGNGYWLWKPYFIIKTLGKIEHDDYLIYSDSGSFYINSVDTLISCMEAESTDIMIFSLPENILERMYSKRDAFILMECDSNKYSDTPQRLGGFILLKKTSFSYKFVSEWLKYASDIRIISDKKNCMGKENYSDFRENRHDQTILSLLSKKYDIKSFRDPSNVDENYEIEVKNRSNYPQIFCLHRMGNIQNINELENKYNEWIEALNHFTDTLKSWHDKDIILYGAGTNAKRIISYIKDRKIKIRACVISDNQKINESKIIGIKVFYFSEIKYFIRKSVVIVTISVKEVVEQLRRENCFIYCINDKVLEALCHFKSQDEIILAKKRINEG